jgi:hypothetical protein
MTTLTITVDSCSERMCLRYQNRIGGTSRVRRATNTPVPGTRRTSPLAIWETRSSTGSCISSASSCTAAVPSAKPASARQAVATPPPLASLYWRTESLHQSWQTPTRSQSPPVVVIHKSRAWRQTGPRQPANGCAPISCSLGLPGSAGSRHSLRPRLTPTAGMSGAQQSSSFMPPL